MSLARFHKVFGGKKRLPEQEMRSSLVTGGAVTLANRMTREHGWNGSSLLAAPIAVLEAGAVVDMHWCLLGSLKNLVFAANLLWAGADKNLKVTVKMDDMAMFSFPGSSNLTFWLDRVELDVSYSHSTTQEQEVVESRISFDQAKVFGAKEFCLRALVTPRDHLGAGVWVAAAPYTRQELGTRLGGNSSNHLTPQITLQVRV